QLRGQVIKIQGLERVERRGWDAVIDCRLRQNPGVGSAVEWDAAEGVRDTVEVFERTGHSSAARAAGEHKSAIDVKKKECLQDRAAASAVSLHRVRCRRAALWAMVPHRS